LSVPCTSTVVKLILLCRYLSRCLLIEFKHPRIDSTIEEFDKLFLLMEKSSSVLGFLIHLGKKFVEKTTALDKCILPKIYKVLNGEVVHRVSIGYGILIWFVLEVCMCFQLYTCIINAVVLNSGDP